MAAQGPSSEGIYETWRTEPGGKYWVIGEAASRSQSGCLSQPQPPRGRQLYRVTSDAQIPAQPHSRNPTRACIREGSPAQVRLGLGAGGFAYRRGCARGGESTESSFIPPCPGWGCSAEEPLPPPVSARFGSSRSRPAVNAVCRRQAPAGRTEIPRCPRLEARRSREMVLGAACPTSALCKRSCLIFSFVFSFLNAITHGPGGHSCPAGAAQIQVRPSGRVNRVEGAQFLVENVVTTCPLRYLD